MPSGAAWTGWPSGAGGRRVGRSTPRTCASSPVSYISVTMSQPPTSSPLTNSCGIVGQSESALSSWRMRGSGRMSTAANGASSACSAATVRAEKPHVGLLGRALHEEDHAVVGDRLGDRVADRVGGLLAHGTWVLRDNAWMGPPISPPNTS